MNSTVENKSNLERAVTIEVPKEAVTAGFNTAYKKTQKTATIKGFRKGKAPLDKVKAMYGEKITPDVLNDLINENYFKALEEHKLTPIDYPQINVENFSETDGLKFTATLEVRPEVTPKNYENLEIKKEILEVKPDQVDNVLENLRKNHSTETDVLEDRPAANGDISIINFEGFVNNEPLEGGAGNDHPLELGANQFIPGFEEGVIGMKVGDKKDLPLKFPEEYNSKEIAGKDVLFKVELKALKKKDLPEVNDAFANKVAEEYKTLDDLKKAIEKDITNGEEKRINDSLKDNLLQELVKKNPVDVPPSMVAKQKTNLINDMKQKMSQQGMAPDQFKEYESKWDSDFEKTATTMIQSTFLINALAKKYKLAATDEDFSNKLNDYSAQMGIDHAQLKEYYGKPEQRTQLDFQITEDKVVDFLISKAKVQEVAKDKMVTQG